MAEEDPLIGAVLAHDFHIRRLLGFGGYARVYLAEQISVGRRHVAVKVLHSMHLDGAGQAAFKREVAILAMLKSPVFPRILRAGVTRDGRPFFVMEHIGGKTLDVILKERKRLSVEQVLHLVEAIGDGLAEMHRRDLIHRDIKPGNIAVEESPPGTWRFYLLDLGSAKPLTEGASVSTTTAKWRQGSPPYLAPETVREGIFSERTDIYSLAAVAYEALCGLRAIHVKNPTTEEYIAYLKSDKPIPTYRIATVEPQIPEAIEEVVQKALSRSPSERYASVPEFLDALRKAASMPSRPFSVRISDTGKKPGLFSRLQGLFPGLGRKKG